MNSVTLLISVLIVIPLTNGILPHSQSSDVFLIGQTSNNENSTAKNCSSMEFCNSRRNVSFFSDENACRHEVRQLSAEQFGAIIDSTLQNFDAAAPLQLSAMEFCNANDILRLFPYWDYRLDLPAISLRNSRLIEFLNNALDFVNQTRLMDTNLTEALTNFTDKSLFNLNAVVEESLFEWNFRQLPKSAVNDRYLNVGHILKLLLTMTVRTSMEDHDSIFDRIQCERAVEWLQWKASSQKCKAKFIKDRINNSSLMTAPMSDINIQNISDFEDTTTNKRKDIYRNQKVDEKNNAMDENNSKNNKLNLMPVVNPLESENNLEFIQNNSNILNEFRKQKHSEITETRVDMKEYDNIFLPYFSPYLFVLPSVSNPEHISNNVENVSKSDIYNVMDIMATSITTTINSAEITTIESIKNNTRNLVSIYEEQRKANIKNNERNRRRKNHKKMYKQKKSKNYLKSTIRTTTSTSMPITATGTEIWNVGWNNASEAIMRRHYDDDKFHKKSGYYKFNRKSLAKHRTPLTYSSAENLATGIDMMSDKDANGRYIFDTKYNFPEEKLPHKDVYSNDDFANVKGAANMSNDNNNFTSISSLTNNKIDDNIDSENHLDRLLKYLSKPKLPKGTIRWKSRAIPIPTAYFTITIIEGSLSRQNRPPFSTSNKRVSGVQIYVTGLNMPTGYTQITEGHQLKGSSAALVRTLSPLSSGPFVEFKVRVLNKYGNSCRQLCLDSSQRYRRCARKTLRISSYRRFSDPIPFYRTVADALDNQWTGRGYYRRRKYDYLLFRCD